MKNIIASVKARLLNLARAEERSHQLLLLRFFQERLLYRLSLSEYKEVFYLKGAGFLYALEGEKSRVTKDLDFLGSKVSRDQESLRDIFRTIVAQDYRKDGVTFDANSMTTETINKDGDYKGVRINLMAYLGTTRQKLQIDIGFGDAVVPGPVLMSYPVILDLDAPWVYTYSIESTIAEKFEAMISLGQINTRMKDFYDVYHLLRKQVIDQNTLEKAIRATFTRRNTMISEDHSLFSEDFKTDSRRKAMWAAWLKKTQLNPRLEFPTVMALLQQKLEPIYRKLLR